MSVMLENALRTAVGTHGAWKLKLQAAVHSGIAGMTEEQAADDTCCKFGKWMNAREQAPLHGDRHFQKIKAMHTNFHRCAGDVIGATLRGDQGRAEQILDADFMPQSEQLMEELRDWLRETKRVNAA